MIFLQKAAKFLKQIYINKKKHLKIKQENAKKFVKFCTKIKLKVFFIMLLNDKIIQCRFC